MNRDKHYTDWHPQKNDIHAHKTRPFFHEREVWFTSLGANIGFEKDGKGHKFLRPVVILKKFNHETLWAIPTTSKNRVGAFYFKFFYRSSEQTTAILSQLRLIDSKRLSYKIGSMNVQDFTEIKKRLTSFLK